MWCKLLSDRSAVPIVAELVVTDTERAHFEQPMLWLRSPVHSGDFGIDSAPRLWPGVLGRIHRILSQNNERSKREVPMASWSPGFLKAGRI
ncbi:unnamed protein product [Effrenium voratum]|nr:unnamed protein product [Effrenium voratum]